MKTSLVLLAVAIASCADDNAVVSGPRFELSERTYDVGAVEPGTSMRHAFPFRNSGGRTLRIGGLRAGCGCRASVTPAEAIPAGDTGAVELACATTECAGAARRTVTVYSNDAVQPAVLLELTAEVAADIAARPPELYFGRAHAGERLARPLRLRLARPDAIPRSARGESGLLTAALERHDDDEWRVALTLSPQAPSGTLRDRIVIETASPRQPTLVVPVLGNVVERSAAE